ncbi:hypothetical protein BV22DRAFT_983905, partial [Leucogyrophana mollusca]
HFKKLQEVFNKDDILLQNILNYNVIGIQLGGGCKSTGEQFFFAHLDKSRYKLKSDDLELVTVIKSVCADGTAPIKPCFVFSSVHHAAQWYNSPDGILIAITENEWTSNKVCQQWFTKNFVRDARAHTDPSKPIVLI